MNSPLDDEAHRQLLGERLRRAREYLGFSQDEVSSFLGVPRTAVTNMERGQRKVEALELKRLAQLYKHSVDHFTDDDDASAAALPPDVSHLARQAAQLNPKDREELARFAEFLNSRSKAREK